MNISCNAEADSIKHFLSIHSYNQILFKNKKHKFQRNGMSDPNIKMIKPEETNSVFSEVVPTVLSISDITKSTAEPQRSFSLLELAMEMDELEQALSLIKAKVVFTYPLQSEDLIRAVLIRKDKTLQDKLIDAYKSSGRHIELIKGLIWQTNLKVVDIEYVLSELQKAKPDQLKKAVSLQNPLDYFLLFTEESVKNCRLTLLCFKKGFRFEDEADISKKNHKPVPKGHFPQTATAKLNRFIENVLAIQDAALIIELLKFFKSNNLLSQEQLIKIVTIKKVNDQASWAAYLLSWTDKEWIKIVSNSFDIQIGLTNQHKDLLGVLKQAIEITDSQTSRTELYRLASCDTGEALDAYLNGGKKSQDISKKQTPKQVLQSPKVAAAKKASAPMVTASVVKQTEKASSSAVTVQPKTQKPNGKKTAQLSKKKQKSAQSLPALSAPPFFKQTNFFVKNVSEQILDPEVLEIVRTLKDKGHDCYLVGSRAHQCAFKVFGVTAEKFRIYENTDYDIVTTASLEQLQILLGEEFKVVGKDVRTGLLSREGGKKIDFIPLAGDATQSLHERLVLDGAGRIFNFNIYVCLSGKNLELVFLSSGKNAIKEKVIHFVDAQTAIQQSVFSQDKNPVAMLRVIGYAARYGFVLDEVVRDEIKKHATAIKTVHGIRLYQEICKLFIHGYGCESAQLLEDNGLLQPLFGVEKFSQAMKDFLKNLDANPEQYQSPVVHLFTQLLLLEKNITENQLYFGGIQNLLFPIHVKWEMATEMIGEIKKPKELDPLPMIYPAVLLQTSLPTVSNLTTLVSSTPTPKI